MERVSLIYSLVIIAVLLTPSFTREAEAQVASGEDKVYLASEVTRKAVIQEKPAASSRGGCPDRGVVRIRVVLHKSGKVTEVKFLRKMSCGFDENVREAASKIKFNPATKDGVAVSQYATLEYAYTRY